MSKRYGRNQKRRANKQIQELALSNFHYGNQLIEMSERNRANEIAISETIEVLGKHFCSLQDSEVIYVRDYLDRIDLYTGDTSVEKPTAKGQELSEKLYRVLSLPIIRTGVHNDKLREMVIVNIMAGSRRSSELAVSEEAVRNMPIEILSNRIANALAKSISEKLKEALK